jgi:hypothetical protein
MTNGSNWLLLWSWNYGLEFRDMPLPVLGSVMCVIKPVSKTEPEHVTLFETNWFDHFCDILCFRLPH